MTLVAVEGTYFNPDFLELLEYFGPYFRLEWCNGLDPKVNIEYRAGGYKDTEDFSRRTFVFLYHSIGLMPFGTTRLYIAQLLQMAAGKANTTLIDVGAGAGQLGLALHHLGFLVSFADIFGQSLYFLAWRLRRRGLDLPIYILDDDKVEIPKHDIAVCFDVVEHVGAGEKRNALLDRLADMGKLVLVNVPYQADDGAHLAVDPLEITEYLSSRYGTFAWDFYSPNETEPRKPDDKPWQRLLIYGKEVNAMVARLRQSNGTATR